MMSRNHAHDAGRRSPARRRVWGYCTVGLVAIAVSAAVSFRPLLSGHSEVRQVRRDDLALKRVADLRTTLSEFQVFIEPHLSHLAPASPTDLANGALLATAVTPRALAVAKALPAIGLADTARQLETTDASFTAAFSGLSVIASGRPSPAVTAAATAERAAFARLWAVTATTETQLRAAQTLDLQQGMRYLDDGRATVLLVDLLAAAVTLCAAFVLGRRARRRELLERSVARVSAYETALQNALDMSRAEPEVYSIVGKALKASVPHLQVEMLVADSSRAHFNEALNTGAGVPNERSGCGVVSPLDCPAISRGHTLVFPSSEALDACPYLQARSTGDCSAACVAISIAGKTVGVTHATGPDGQPPTASDIRDIEITSRRAADRIAMLRAFEKSETQARSDPLTGLWNRRSLENHVRDLHREGIPYALAFGDLDHFKNLNDTHGHESGDQALRLFSRVLRDAIRPNDVAARYGGEEFVIVLPDCDTESASKVLERVRERLALALTTGRVPSFTVSFGVAASSDADTFDEVVAIADHALFAAKTAGRNRVVVAIDSADTGSSRPRLSTPPEEALESLAAP